ncbi:MAG: phage holin family protein [Flavobacterium sp.]|uniref:phage holin family protein n=1 Tax=Flavobacterium sp. TaxID=239 RepID=UPI0022BF3E89|nr:phage holin family protein [Flavobacterium sp.]MCZ8196987.1 phage holin family protein [Flavobacterium sp.]
MNTLIRIIITAILVLVIDYFMSGITVASFTTSILVAIVLALLNTFIKPLLIFFTFPVTILTLGLFLLVINAIIIILCSKIVGGFHVDSFWTALLFSIILSLSQSLMNGLTKEKK